MILSRQSINEEKSLATLELEVESRYKESITQLRGDVNVLVEKLNKYKKDEQERTG